MHQNAAYIAVVPKGVGIVDEIARILCSWLEWNLGIVLHIHFCTDSMDEIADFQNEVVCDTPSYRKFVSSP